MREYLFIFLISLLSLACASEQTSQQPKSSAELLLETPGSIGLSRVGEVRTFVGQTLYEYINGGAELYHAYDFIEVSTGDYTKGKIELVADIYQFDGVLNAYGLYSMLRPDNPDFVRLGAEGYSAPATIMFVAGPYMVKVIGFEDNDEVNLAMINLAQELAAAIEKTVGQVSSPAMFDLFPIDNRINGSTKYWASAFMGHEFLSDVYSVDYQIDTTLVTLFLSDSDAATKINKWTELARGTSVGTSPDEGLVFDDTGAIAIEDVYYDRIVVGVKGNKLVGMTAYSSDFKGWLNEWLETLGTSTVL